MGLFREPLQQILSYCDHARAAGELREFEHSRFMLWPEKKSLVLQDDTQIELGSSTASLFLILWTGEKSAALEHGRISLIGPDLGEVDEARIPFIQIVLIKGQFEDEYETYRELRDIIFDTRPEGVSTRIWPDRQKIWCRVSKEAMAQGFNLIRYGNTLIKNLKGLKGVDAAEILFITGAAGAQEQLRTIAERVQGIVEALLKMYEEMNFDCEDCEYNEVCAEVTTLRDIRERLRKERQLQ
ncbi:MAG: hypothetical protein GYA86_10210 [Firmicutes bacterium]|jgi:CO dehydrogenase/acetyl-CoA synthase beta subunit|nr:hypothetical protein [Bacillota bacterium]